MSTSAPTQEELQHPPPTSELNPTRTTPAPSSPTSTQQPTTQCSPKEDLDQTKQIVDDNPETASTRTITSTSTSTSTSTNTSTSTSTSTPTQEELKQPPASSSKPTPTPTPTPTLPTTTTATATTTSNTSTTIAGTIATATARLLLQVPVVAFRYFAILKCDALKAPAIFLSWEDCSYYVDDEENDSPPNYQEFETLDQAKEYIHNHAVALALAVTVNKNKNTKNNFNTNNNKMMTRLPMKENTPIMPTSTTSPSAVTATVTETDVAPKIADLNRKPPGGESNTADVKKASPKTKQSPPLAAVSVASSSSHPKAAVIARTSLGTEATEAEAEATAKRPPPTATTSPSPARKKAKTTSMATAAPPKSKPKPKGRFPKTQKGRDTMEAAQQQKQRESRWFGLTKAQKSWLDSLEEMTAKLQEYKDKHGTCDVPRRSPTLEPEYEPLGIWVKSTRRLLKAYHANPESSFITRIQIKKLLDMGFLIQPKRGAKTSGNSKTRLQQRQRKVLEETWEENIKHLQKYKDENGTCDVPLRGKSVQTEFAALGKWVHKIREDMKCFDNDPSSALVLDQTRIKVLLDIGFLREISRGVKSKRFGPEDAAEDFETMLADLQTHLEKEMPLRNNFKLMNWIGKQRKEYNEFKGGNPSTMTPKRIVRLAEAGFIFQAKQKKSFDERAVQWLEYRSKHGKDPKRYTEDGLGKWVCTQRSKYQMTQDGKDTNLTQDQIDRLTEWGFHWGSKIKKPLVRAEKKSWQERYDQLVQYKTENGNCLVPQHYPQLGQWVHTQRNDYRKFVTGHKSVMTKDRLDKLNAVGFVFRTSKGRSRTHELARSALRLSNVPRSKSDNDETADEGTQADARSNIPQLQPPLDPTLAQLAFAPWERYQSGRR